MPSPFFTVVITTYNRERIVRRCLDSCLDQTEDDFEVVVVDDASTDGTVAALERYEDPRLRVVVRDRNCGINPARHKGVENARGQWVVMVDSDDELLPHTLESLRRIIDGLPAGVRVVRSRLLWDDGTVTPHFVPAQPIGYEGRIRWIEAEGGNDAARCTKRSVFEQTPYIDGRRGAMETLFELRLARNETMLCVDDVLGKVHSDAANSWLRSTAASELIPRLYAEAPDMLWMAETTLHEHGAALRAFGPSIYRRMLRVASTQAFLLGRRRLGFRYGFRALRQAPLDPLVIGTLVLGGFGPWAVARGVLGARRLGL
jgi:glycosyltransferase involved in cell wall biosynthesis